MFFINCDLCFAAISRNMKMYISTCCHLICTKCVVNPRQCAVCGANSKLMEINKDMSRDVKEYLEPYEDKMRKLIKVAKFQNEKMDKFIDGKVHIMAKYAKNKASIYKLKDAFNSVARAIHEEKLLIQKLRNRKQQASPRLITTSPHSPAIYQSPQGDRTASPNILQQKMKINPGEARTPPSSSGVFSQESNRFMSRSSDSSGSQTRKPQAENISVTPEFMKNTKKNLCAQAYHNLTNSGRKSNENLIKFSHRSDIDRARNVMF